MNITLDNIIQIVAFSTGIGSLIVLTYLSLLSSRRGIRFALMIVLCHALNYSAGIAFSLEPSFPMAEGLKKLLAVLQILSVPVLLFFVRMFIGTLGKLSSRFIDLTGKVLLSLILLVDLVLLFLPVSMALLSHVIAFLVLIYAVFLWIFLYHLKASSTISNAVRRTGLIGYGIIIPLIAFERVFREPLTLHPAGAVSFLFLTTCSLLFSVKFLMRQGGGNPSVSGKGDPADLQRSFGLTDRELEVMGLLLGGSSYKEIASRLGISMPTVKTHVSRIYKKTGTKGRSELKYRFKALK